MRIVVVIRNSEEERKDDFRKEIPEILPKGLGINRSLYGVIVGFSAHFIEDPLRLAEMSAMIIVEAETETDDRLKKNLEKILDEFFLKSIGKKIPISVRDLDRGFCGATE